jgi:hypothetical protein
VQERLVGLIQSQRIGRIISHLKRDKAGISTQELDASYAPTAAEHQGYVLCTYLGLKPTDNNAFVFVTLAL